MPARHARVFTTVSGVDFPTARLYVLYRYDGTCVEPFVPLIQYFLDRGAEAKLPWQEAHANSVRLLLDHLEAMGEAVDDAGMKALQRFVQHLSAGTVDDEGHDPSGLYWRGCSLSTVALHLSRVSEFADWLSGRLGTQPLNPWRAARPDERIVRLKRLERASSQSLLSHAAYRRAERKALPRVRTVQVRAGGGSSLPVLAFPEAKLAALIDRGWARPAPRGAPLSARYRLRDLMITVLMHGAGLRKSECFHLYLGDVMEDPDHPGSARVLQFHPALGEAPAEPGGPWRNRRHYLQRRFGLRPRNEEVGGMHAGWKNLVMIDGRRQYTQAFWVDPRWGRYFWELFKAYARHRPGATHPFLFTTEYGPTRGQPYTLKAFEDHYAAALKRAGIAPGKRAGASPHAHRHAVGLRLAEAGVSRHLIQTVLHHRSPSSQDAYHAAPATEIDRVLREAATKIDAPFLNQLPDDEP